MFGHLRNTSPSFTGARKIDKTNSKNARRRKRKRSSVFIKVCNRSLYVSSSFSVKDFYSKNLQFIFLSCRANRVGGVAKDIIGVIRCRFCWSLQSHMLLYMTISFSFLFFFVKGWRRHSTVTAQVQMSVFRLGGFAIVRCLFKKEKRKPF